MTQQKPKRLSSKSTSPVDAGLVRGISLGTGWKLSTEVTEDGWLIVHMRRVRPGTGSRARVRVAHDRLVRELGAFVVKSVCGTSAFHVYMRPTWKLMSWMTMREQELTRRDVPGQMGLPLKYRRRSK